MSLLFEHLNVMGCQTYIVSSSDSDETWIIDPLLSKVHNYLKTLEQNKRKLTKVIDTHTHADHLSGAAKLRDQTGCAYVMHQLGQPREVTDKLTADTKLQLGGETIKIMHTPGHTRDSLCLVFPDRIITGDTLFLDDGGAGRDDLPGGDAGEHWESLMRIKELNHALTVFPGHDYRDRKPSTIADQIARNPFFKPATQAEYIHFLEELKLGPVEWMKEVLKANCACTRDPHAVQIPVGVSACEVQGTMTCSGTGEISQIEPESLKELLDKGKQLFLLDVRESRELVGELGHLPNIKHIPVGSLPERLEELAPYRETEIYSICKMGGRATTAAKILAEAGFTKVVVLAGGMTGWNQSGLPVTYD